MAKRGRPIDVVKRDLRIKTIEDFVHRNFNFQNGKVARLPESSREGLTRILIRGRASYREGHKYYPEQFTKSIEKFKEGGTFEKWYFGKEHNESTIDVNSSMIKLFGSRIARIAAEEFRTISVSEGYTGEHSYANMGFQKTLIQFTTTENEWYGNMTRDQKDMVAEWEALKKANINNETRIKIEQAIKDYDRAYKESRKMTLDKTIQQLKKFKRPELINSVRKKGESYVQQTDRIIKEVQENDKKNAK